MVDFFYVYRVYVIDYALFSSDAESPTPTPPPCRDIKTIDIPRVVVTQAGARPLSVTWLTSQPIRATSPSLDPVHRRSVNRRPDDRLRLVAVWRPPTGSTTCDVIVWRQRDRHVVNVDATDWARDKELTRTEHTLNTDVYYTLAAKKPDSLIMGLKNTIEQ